MTLLLDAHISKAVLHFLESRGHDCVHAGLLPPRTSDTELLARAIAENRIIVTADKDFGELVFRRQLPAAGVVMLRMKLPAEAARTERFKTAWGGIESSLPGHFIVVTDTLIRRRPLPNL